MPVDDGRILRLGLCDVATRSIRGLGSLCSFISSHCGKVPRLFMYVLMWFATLVIAWQAKSFHLYCKSVPEDQECISKLLSNTVHLNRKTRRIQPDNIKRPL